MYSSLLQWGRGALSYSTDKIITFPISFINFRKIVAMHYGDMTTVNVIEDMDYRTNLTSTLLKTNYQYTADAEYIVIGF